MKSLTDIVNELSPSDKAAVDERATQLTDEEIRLMREQNTKLRGAIEGLLTEWDRLTRYGSPMAKAANERVAAARRLLEEK
jgi:hypothetical protein